MSKGADVNEYQRHELVERTGSGDGGGLHSADNGEVKSQRRQLEFDELGRT